MRKLEKSEEQEYTVLELANPNLTFEQVFAPKPVARIDPALYDVSPILRDMEKVSGVQESQMASVVQAKTATEASIQQTGFAARTSTNRDDLEDMLGELAQYTAEIAVQALEIPEVQRIAGPAAFWPHGMAIDDLLTMVEVSITAGSTGKPNTAADRQSWSVVLPMLQQLIVQIQQMRMTGNEPLAQAMIELMRETLTRMGDNIDIDRFIPKAAPMQPMAPPGMIGPPGAPAPLAPGVHPSPHPAPPSPGGAPPLIAPPPGAHPTSALPG
jgi:hypothetical protein